MSLALGGGDRGGGLTVQSDSRRLRRGTSPWQQSVSYYSERAGHEQARQLSTARQQQQQQQREREQLVAGHGSVAGSLALELRPVYTAGTRARLAAECVSMKAAAELRAFGFAARAIETAGGSERGPAIPRF